MFKNCVRWLKVVHHCLTLGLLRGLEERPLDAPLTERDLIEILTLDITNRQHSSTFDHIYCSVLARAPNLWLCAAVSRALRGGVGDPCSVTLSTSKLFLSGRQRPWRVSIGESTRFRGGSAEEQPHTRVSALAA